MRLIHWSLSAAEACLARLREQGHDVAYSHKYESWKEDPPDAYVIDLSRLPSHGREVAVALRTKKSTRAVPIIFVEGAPEKVEALRKLFIDATFSTWSKVGPALKKAIANPPVNPATPTPMMDRYVGRSAAQKLGIKEGTALAVFDPPHDYLKILGELPPDVRI